MQKPIKPKISIVVPVYKVEKYLDKCIKSILAQTFKEFELILVDDGSPDNCGKICDSYKEQDERVRVIHQKNAGLSCARNTGIDEAAGEYIGFVDSDDYIASDMFSFLYENLINNNADISVCGLYNCFGEKLVPQYDKEELYILKGEEALKMALEGVKFSMHAVNKLYKKSLFESCKFPPGKLSEDAFTIPVLLSNAKAVVVNTVPKYYYIQRRESITNSSFKENDFDVVLAYSKNLDMVKQKFPSLKKQAEFRYLWSYMYVLDKMLLTQNFKDVDKLNEIILKLRKNTSKILLNPYFSKKRKFAMALLFFNHKLYSKLVRRNNETKL
ncbi:MAG: Undecaprenyl-phosphate 4-deoxy-4-formamido-L-arabinose transferase [Eubacteriales bacterium SKADARSKE-1]|nr:Undecaprenyl-phosphate 4-deoxy-4-formamido-L-arabinose transferase [Eubacteriales bacterium SKADARSKE-1]